MPHKRQIIGASLLLAVFGIVGAGLVSLTHAMTRDRIAAAERQAFLALVEEVLPAAMYDNELLLDAVTVADPALLGAPATRVYRARRQAEPVALVLNPVVAQGYNGAIRLIVAVRSDGSLGGVRVLSHRETPGLGDKIERRRSAWIDSFSGRSLSDPPATGWRVRRDGGEFDQFTGATITPRAVVGQVHRTLEYVLTQWPALVEAKPQEAPQ